MSLVRIKSVKWVTSQSSQYLTSMVLKKNGLVGLMHALLPSDKCRTSYPASDVTIFFPQTYETTL